MPGLPSSPPIMDTVARSLARRFVGICQLGLSIGNKEDEGRVEEAPAGGPPRCTGCALRAHSMTCPEVTSGAPSDVGESPSLLTCSNGVGVVVAAVPEQGA